MGLVKVVEGDRGTGEGEGAPDSVWRVGRCQCSRLSIDHFMRVKGQRGRRRESEKDLTQSLVATPPLF